MLLIAKTQKFGALTILCLIINILLIIGGHPWIALIYSIPVTVIADYIMARGHYQNTKLNALGYIIFQCGPSVIYYRFTYETNIFSTFS